MRDSCEAPNQPKKEYLKKNSELAGAKVPKHDVTGTA